VAETRPSLILTRPRPQAERFADDVRARFGARFDIVIAPVIEIVPVEATPDTSRYAALLFTSENGVRSFAARWGARDLPAYCVGARTAAAARAAGFAARSAGGDAAALARLVVAELPAGARVLHLRGRHAAGDLAGRLRAAGIAADEAVIYDQAARAPSAEALAALGSDAPVLVPLFSPRSARLLAAALDGRARPAAGAVALCLSPAVAAALPAGLFADQRIAASPDAGAMLDLLAAWN
jgi:uroporphyrinogen-III synthase